MNGFQWIHAAVMNGLGRSCLQYFLMDGPEKRCFLCFFGVVMIAGLVKACFLWFVICGLEKVRF